MYATNLTDQLFSAALPLKPLVAWCGSACSVTVAVPPALALAGLSIGSVGVTLSLPDGSSVAVQAVHVANTPLWTATFPAANFAMSGTVANGLMVTLAGEDENGVVRTWIVAKGDIEVRPGDASPSPSGSWVAVKLREDAPENPVDGDAYVADGALHIFTGGEWVEIGGGVVVDPSIDPESVNPVENRAVAAALDGKLDGAAVYPEWTENAPYLTVGTVVSYKGLLWRNTSPTYHHGLPPGREGSVWTSSGVNIKNLKQDVLTFDSAPTANSVNPVTSGGVYTALQGKANATDLPYALVTPGEWDFSDGGSYDISGPFEDTGSWYYTTGVYRSNVFNSESEAVAALTLTFTDPSGQSDSFNATRASLPGHLCDRAGNRVVVTGDTTLTLPEIAHAGRLRDFLVRLEISGSTVPTITFAAPTGETVTYETDGDEFPVPDEAGNWVYSFTENCAAHKFAVSLKKVNVVTQGGV